MAELKALSEKMRENADYVGDKFAEEARKIHFGETDQRGIYGEATPDEASSLAEDGVEFMPIPVFPTTATERPSLMPLARRDVAPAQHPRSRNEISVELGFGLLLVTGALLGLTLPFGKIATDGGVPPILWAFVISCGAGGVLLVALLVRGHRLRARPRTSCAISSIAAAISYAIPNLLMFSAIPHLAPATPASCSRCRR